MWPARSVSSVVCSRTGPCAEPTRAAAGTRLASTSRSPPRPRRRSAYIARFVAFCLRFARGFYLFSSAPRIRLGVAVGPGRRAARRRRGPGRTAAVPRAGRAALGRFRAKGFLFHPFISRARGAAAAPPGGALETCRYHVFRTGRVCRAGGCARLRCCAVPGGCVAAAAAAAARARARFHIFEGIA